MRFALLAFISFLFFRHEAPAQSLGWVKGFGGSGSDYGDAIALDDAGNVYTAGHFTGTADFDPGGNVYNVTSTGNYDIFIQKLDAQGNFVWVKTIGGTGADYVNAMAVDGVGNIYITGPFQNTVDFDPGNNVYNLTSAGMQDIYCLKLNGAGNFEWATSTGGPNNDYGFGIAVDSTGSNVCITGYFFAATVDFDPGVGTYNLTSNGQADCFVQKLSAQGSFVWARSVGGTNAYGDVGQSVAFDGSGSVYVVGKFGGTVDFDPGPGVYTLTTPSATAPNIFTLKLNVNGNFLWAQQAGNTSNNDGFSVRTDVHHNNYTTGLINNGSTQNTFITKRDENGTIVWSRSFVNNTGNNQTATALDEHMNVYVTGVFLNTIDIDPGQSVVNLVAQGSSYNAFVLKLDSLGYFNWAVGIGNGGECTGKAIEVSPSGNAVFTTGYFTGTVDFDPGPAVVTTTFVSVYDAYVLKLVPCTPAPPANINPGGATTMCVNNFTALSAPLSPGLTYQWKLNGDPINAATGSSYLPSAAGAYSVVVSNGSCSVTSPYTTITVDQPLPQPSFIAGPQAVCDGDTITYNAAVVSGASSYGWSLPSGWLGFSTNSFMHATAGPNGGIISVTANNSCGPGPAKNLSATVNTIPTPVITQNGQQLSTTAGQGIYQWYKDGTAIPGATGSSYTTTQPGNYHVKVTSGACSKISNQVSIPPLSISTAKSDEHISFFPNPGIGIFHLNVSGTFVRKIDVYNAEGKRCFAKEINSASVINETIDLCGSPAGFYTLRITTDETSRVIPFSIIK